MAIFIRLLGLTRRNKNISHPRGKWAVIEDCSKCTSWRLRPQGLARHTHAGAGRTLTRRRVTLPCRCPPLRARRHAASARPNTRPAPR
eukprot:4038763-Prymnesium_polylepis.1